MSNVTDAIVVTRRYVGGIGLYCSNKNTLNTEILQFQGYS